MTERDIIVLRNIRVEIPANDPKAVLVAKKVLDLYLDDLLPEKRLITAKRIKP